MMDTPEEILDFLDLAPIAKLAKDLKESASLISTMQARFLVDLYYIQQERQEAGKKPGSINGRIWRVSRNHFLDREKPPSNGGHD